MQHVSSSRPTGSHSSHSGAGTRCANLATALPQQRPTHRKAGHGVQADSQNARQGGMHGQAASSPPPPPAGAARPAAAELRGSAAAHPQLRYDCLGLAQAMVDIAVTSGVEDELLAELGVAKGGRRLISLEERGQILERLQGADTAIAAGGSLSNTLLALARLGDAGSVASGGVHRPLNVGMAGLLGGDPLGEFFAASLAAAGVQVAAAPVAGAATGTVVVLTSDDASRSMLSYLGSPTEVAVDAALEQAIAASRLLVIEGYLWELPGARRTIGKAIAAAQAAGTVVAMTAGDAGTVERHSEEMWEAIDAGIDILFTNGDEAAALLQHERPSAAQQRGAAASSAALHSAAGEKLALRLAPHCPVVVVTDGSRGSFLAALGELHCVPPCWMGQPPVDTCGAGDAYAAGLLWAYLRGAGPRDMGRAAARAASAVIAKAGAQLTPEAAAAVASALLAGERPWSATALAP